MAVAIAERVDGETLDQRSCPRCGSAESRPRLTGRDRKLGIGGSFFVAQCGGCGLLFQNPGLKADLLAKHYPDDYAPYAPREARLGPTTLWYLRARKRYAHLPDPPDTGWLRRRFGRWASGIELLPDFVQDGELLEIGCGSGNRLELLKRLGWSRCSGIEFSRHAASLARDRGFVVEAGRVEDLLEKVPPASLDVVVASFVLEHLADPFRVAEAIGSKLKPGGQFLLSTLDVGSPDFALYGEYWYNLDLPRHFTFFRKSDLEAMLARSFRIEGVFRKPSVTDYVGSAAYRLKHESRSIDRRIVSLGGKLRPACQFLALFGVGSRICIHARKN